MSLINVIENKYFTKHHTKTLLPIRTVQSIINESLVNYVGINTTAPKNTLDVNGGTIIRGRLNMEDKADPNLALYTPLYNNNGVTVIRTAPTNDTLALRSDNQALFASFTNGLIILGQNSAVHGSLRVGSQYAVDESSALLQLTSTEKGFLPPKMTSAQADAIPTPAEGLIVFVTDSNSQNLNFPSAGLYVRLNSAWNGVVLTPAAQP